MATVYSAQHPVHKSRWEICLCHQQGESPKFGQQMAKCHSLVSHDVTRDLYEFFSGGPDFGKHMFPVAHWAVAADHYARRMCLPNRSCEHRPHLPWRHDPQEQGCRVIFCRPVSSPTSMAISCKWLSLLSHGSCLGPPPLPQFDFDYSLYGFGCPWVCSLLGRPCSLSPAVVGDWQRAGWSHQELLKCAGTGIPETNTFDMLRLCPSPVVAPDTSAVQEPFCTQAYPTLLAQRLRWPQSRWRKRSSWIGPWRLLLQSPRSPSWDPGWWPFPT